MARQAKKAPKKAAPPSKKAAKPSRKTAKKKTAQAPPKAVKPAKTGARKTAPKKKAAGRATSAKKAVSRPSAAKPKAAAARKPSPPASIAPPAPPPPVPAKPIQPAKLTPAQLEELRITKERRKAQERQADHYDKASKAFQTRHYQRALGLFEKAAEGPDSTLTDRARVHAAICQRQVKPRKVQLKTADEYYHYGIRLINERRLDEAEKSLDQALKIQPRGAHIHFAVAILSALTRDTASTYKSLKRAIELDPRIRVSALNDTDLASAAKDPAISQLLHGNSESSGGN